MTMTDEQKAEAAERRAQERREAALDRERARQAEIAKLHLDDSSRIAVDYCNAQLLRPERAEDWPDLREWREIHIRQGSRKRR